MQSTLRSRKEHVRVDKENAELQNKMPSVGVVVRKVTSPVVRAKLRKNSDSSDDRLKQARGLQVAATNILNNAPRRRIQSSSDASAAKPFVKSRFAVYNEENTKGAHQPTEQCRIVISNGIGKPVSIYHEKCIPRTVIVHQDELENAKSSSQTSDFKNSPKDLPIITKSDVCQIKEKHNRKSLPRKPPKRAYEVLSLELAYNIDYVSEYIQYQMEINDKKKLSSSFLNRGVSANQRGLIVKYLIDSTTYFKSPSFILYQAVKIFDSYIDRVDVSLCELQTVALAALWIALKKDLIIDDVPEAETIMKLAATSCRDDKKKLLECEKKILMSLKFEVNFADPFSMLALFAIMIEEVRELESELIQELYYCGSYLMDLSMLDKDLCIVLAFHLAEICAEIALVLIMSNENVKDPQWNHWHARILESNPILRKYSLSDSKITYIRNQLLHKAMLSKDEKEDFHAVYRKYRTRRYGAISKFLTNKISSFYVSRIIDSKDNPRPIMF